MGASAIIHIIIIIIIILLNFMDWAQSLFQPRFTLVLDYRVPFYRLACSFKQLSLYAV